MLSRNLRLQEIAVENARQSLLEKNAFIQQVAAHRSQQLLEKEVLFNDLYGAPGSSNHTRIMNEAWNALVATRSNVGSYL